ncbi:MAG TPA: hypothetical protein VE011_09795 [Candidatus Dormibacteraeota bacterium]|nr:hypothetical protein [Candidatus Dormibacteraeota bacterium]
MSEPWRELEKQLAELNELASDRLSDLQDLDPAPAGLPPAGSWIRAARTDLDGVTEPIGPWHLVTGWNGRSGSISLRCSHYRPGWALREAVSAYVGEPASGWPRRAGNRPRLLVAPGAPSEACRRCDSALERDAEAAARAEREREAKARLARLEAVARLVDDVAIPDAELGGRVRRLWNGGAS